MDVVRNGRQHPLCYRDSLFDVPFQQRDLADVIHSRHESWKLAQQFLLHMPRSSKIAPRQIDLRLFMLSGEIEGMVYLHPAFQKVLLEQRLYRIHHRTCASSFRMIGKAIQETVKGANGESGIRVNCIGTGDVQEHLRCVRQLRGDAQILF